MAHLYRPLQRRQIRLMRVIQRYHPSDLGNCIACDLEVFALDSERLPRYKALSYCWTTAEPSQQIFVNGEPFLVRPHLYTYIQRVQLEQDDQWIFIDAICINQTDQDERSNQVALMGDVYREAILVDVWLGTEDDFSNMLNRQLLWFSYGKEASGEPVCRTAADMKQLWKSLCYLGNEIVTRPDADELQSRFVKLAGEIYADTKWIPAINSPQGRYGYTDAARRRVPEIKDLFQPICLHHESERILTWLFDISCHIFKALFTAFCQHEYWTRLWIVQELILAQELSIRFDDLKLNWKALLFFLSVHDVLLGGNLYEGMESAQIWRDNDVLEDSPNPLVQPFQSSMDRELHMRWGLAHNDITTLEGVPNDRFIFEIWRLPRIILHRKRLLQHRSRRRGISLTAAMILFGQQQCTVPHDSVYGMIGMTQTNIKVDYGLPILHLLLRTLLEMKYHIRLASGSMTVEIQDWTTRSMLETMTALIQREAGLMAGVLVISEALEGKLTAKQASQLIIVKQQSRGAYHPTWPKIFSWLGEHSAISKPSRNARGASKVGAKLDIVLDDWLREAVHRARWKTCQLYTRGVLIWLALCKKIDRTPSIGLKSKNRDRETRTYSEWIRFVDDIRREVEKEEELATQPSS